MTDILSDALRNVAMIAEVDTTAIGLSRTDRDASKKAENDHHAAQGSARVVVQRFAGVDDLPKKIMALQTSAIDLLKSMSTAWGSGKRRLLPNANAQAFIKGFATIEAEYNASVKEFVANADDIIARAKANQGEFKVNIPTKDEIAKAYSMSYSLEPVPDGSQFKGSDAVVTHLKDMFEERIKASYVDAQQDALRRLAKPLQKMVERMEAFEERERDLANGKDVGKNGIFRDTIITNIQDIAAVFGSFNLTHDPKLDELTKKIALFGKVDADTIRKRADIRQAAVKHAKSIIEELDDMLI